MKKKFLALMFLVTPALAFVGMGAFIGPPGTNIYQVSVTSPVYRQVIQRGGGATTNLTITGHWNGAGTITSAKAILTVINGGTNVPETTFDAVPVANAFSGTVAVHPGWYSLQVNVYTGASLIGTGYDYKVGMGDVFIAAGQSLQINSGDAPGTTTSDERINMFNQSFTWTQCSDPQTSASGSGSSIWPQFGSAILAQTGFPVGIITVGVSATSVGDWQSTLYASRLKPVIQLFASNGFRGVLWGQGESDATLGTGQSAYTTALEGIIDSSRSDGGWAIPWVINKETSPSGNIGDVSATIQAAQVAVAGYTGCFAGPNVDSLLGATYRSAISQPHMNSTGITSQASLQASAAISAFSL